jgi:hypothetical protein
MKDLIKKVLMFCFVFTVLSMLGMFTAPQARAERMEDDNLYITSKLPPQYLGWKVHVGSTTQTVPVYYKVSAVLSGIGETVAGPVTTAYTTYAPVSSTNSVRLMWAPVQVASSYKLYKSVDNTTFNLLATLTAPTLTYVDEGDAVGAAYSAPSPRGGNLIVENDISAGGDLTVTGNVSVTGTVSFVPETFTLAQMNVATRTAGSQVYVSDGVSATKMCVSTATAGGFVLITSTSTHCQ